MKKEVLHLYVEHPRGELTKVFITADGICYIDIGIYIIPEDVFKNFYDHKYGIISIGNISYTVPYDAVIEAFNRLKEDYIINIET